MEPFRHWESPETKRRFHSLLAVSGLLEKLELVKPQVATIAQLERVHTRQYLEELERASAREEGGNAGEEAPFSQFAFDIARLSAGGVLAAADAVMDGKVDSAYALTPSVLRGSQFDAVYGQVGRQVGRSLASSTGKWEWGDDNVLFVSLHQDNNYPADSGAVSERGGGKGEGFTINVPLPPGSGSGAYEYAFKKVVVPALEQFKPDFVLVSSGFDASYADPLAAMILSSNVFRFMARELVEAAKRLCGGRIVFAHEGGYSETYVPFCGAAVLEELLGVHGVDKQIKDPFLSEVERWGYQELQEHQKKAVDRVVVSTNVRT
ncbi:hypothetical protein PR001_g9475 [Phytophthora rubi]|uniref:Histone deacetylase domain-containing protein n=1 Tax=Phytophthora rubi TaxID=129364 RepID=A0A6A3MPS3_9STRA|nr:hypothetical protein PR001_g9475 [Phytophthora rubi]